MNNVRCDLRQDPFHLSAHPGWGVASQMLVEGDGRVTASGSWRRRIAIIPECDSKRHSGSQKHAAKFWHGKVRQPEK